MLGGRRMDGWKDGIGASRFRQWYLFPTTQAAIGRR